MAPSARSAPPVPACYHAHVLSIPGLSDDDRIAILGGTAAKLLGIN